MRRSTGPKLAMWVTLIGAVYGSIAISMGTPYSWDDIATFFGSASTPYNLCWGVLASEDVSTNPNEPQWVQMLRTREEDQSQDNTAYFRTQWISAAKVAQGNWYCAPGQTLPRQGHYSYQFRLCPKLPPDVTMQGSCSAWVSSKDPTVANMNGTPRAWWIYGAADPTPPVTSVNQ